MPSYRYQQGDRPLDGYTIQYALGRGGFGEVYFAVSDAGREVALKAVQNYEEIEMRGISHCMNLKSQHLVMIFDVRHDVDGTPWVIMEYVSGPSLREILDDSPQGIGADNATYFIRELARGLSYLHEAGVVHRDLKPHNIFFEDGIVKIGDYSLSKAITTGHRSGHTTTVGSVHYMAPEIGAGRYGKTVDLYALGVILYEMLTGAPPYEGESMGEVLMKHLSSQPDVSGLSEPFASVVTKAMCRDPDDRYQDADELIHALKFGDSADFSRPPASLSMIGVRAAEQRKQKVSATPSLADTFVTPVALRDTNDDGNGFGDVSASSDSMPFERPAAASLQTLGLWWRRNEVDRFTTDSTALWARGLLAVIACVGLIMFGCLTVPEGTWQGPSALLFSVGFLGFSLALCWLLLAVLPRQGGLRWAIATRVLATAPILFIGAVVISMSNDRKFAEVSMAFFSFAVAGFLVDWRCFLAIDRQPRVGIIKTLVMGVVAIMAASVMDIHYQPIVLAGAMTMASAIVVQLLAPHGKRLAAMDPSGDIAGVPADPVAEEIQVPLASAVVAPDSPQEVMP